MVSGNLRFLDTQLNLETKIGILMYMYGAEIIT